MLQRKSCKQHPTLPIPCRESKISVYVCRCVCACACSCKPPKPPTSDLHQGGLARSLGLGKPPARKPDRTNTSFCLLNARVQMQAPLSQHLEPPSTSASRLALCCSFFATTISIVWDGWIRFPFPFQIQIVILLYRDKPNQS